jgi:hypothetical protein
MFRFNKTIIREPMVCASLKLQYWRQFNSNNNNNNNNKLGTAHILREMLT